MVNLAPISTQRPLIVTVLGLIAMLGACVYYEPSAIAVDIEPIPDQVATAGDIVELPVVIIGATDNVVSISAVSSDLDLVSDLEVRRMGSSHELMLVAVTHPGLGGETVVEVSAETAHGEIATSSFRLAVRVPFSGRELNQSAGTRHRLPSKAVRPHVVGRPTTTPGE